MSHRPRPWRARTLARVLSEMTEHHAHHEKTVRVVTGAMVVIITEMTAHAHRVRILVHDLHEMTEHRVRRERGQVAAANDD